MFGWPYAEDRAGAEEDITYAGQSGFIRRTIQGSGDPWNPGAGTVTDYPVTLVEDTFNVREIDGQLVRAGDHKVLVSTAGVTIQPKVSDQLVVGDKVLQIVTVTPLSPGGMILMWTIQARD
jgi:hypothetical protein